MNPLEKINQTNQYPEIKTPKVSRPKKEQKASKIAAVAIGKQQNATSKTQEKKSYSPKAVGTKVAKTPIKSKEAENQTPRRCHSLGRTTSAPELHQMRSKRINVDAKSGALWRCIDYQHDVYGGEIYLFRMRSKYSEMFNQTQEALDTKNKQIFPAIEESERVVRLFLSDDAATQFARALKATDAAVKKACKGVSSSKRQEILRAAKLDRKILVRQYQHIIAAQQDLHRLGYKVQIDSTGATLLMLPSREALLARWEKLREARPELPPLAIASSEGVADDIGFIMAFLTNDVLLSTGKEFVHDQLVHLIPTLSKILTSPQMDKKTYPEEKFILFKKIAKSYRRLMIAKKQIFGGPIEGVDPRTQLLAKEKFEQLETALGALVDSLSATSSVKTAASLLGSPEGEALDQRLHDFQGSHWYSYWPKRFEDELELSDLEEILDLVVDIEARYDEIRERWQPGHFVVS